MREGKATILLMLIVGLVFLPSLPGDFHFDDYLLLLDNSDVTSATFRFSSFLDHYGGRPLTLLSFHWNYQLAGRQAVSYVVVDLILHLFCCLLLFGWVRALSGRLYLAFGCALLFGIHPLQTQAVNYVWSRSMLLMAVFGLAALWTARRGPIGESRWQMPQHFGIEALVLFQLAIWSRTEAIAIAPFLIAQGIRPLPVIALVGLNLVGFTIGLFWHAPAETAWQHSNIVDYWLAQPAVLLEYLRMMFFPIGLSIDHDFRPPAWLGGVSALLLTGLLWVGFRFRASPVATAAPPSSECRATGEPQARGLRYFAALWILLLMLPAALIPNEDNFNESRVYLAMAGFSFLAASFVLDRQWGIVQRLPGRIGVALILLLLAGASALRNHQWNDNLGLWQSAAESYPQRLRIQYNLGHAFLLENQFPAAEAAFERALRLNPEDDLSYAALGYCAEVKGDWLRAHDHYRRAFDLNPSNGYAVRGFERAERELGGMETQP